MHEEGRWVIEGHKVALTRHQHDLSTPARIVGAGIHFEELPLAIGSLLRLSSFREQNEQTNR